MAPLAVGGGIVAPAWWVTQWLRGDGADADGQAGLDIVDLAAERLVDVRRRERSGAATPIPGDHDRVLREVRVIEVVADGIGGQVTERQQRRPVERSVDGGAGGDRPGGGRPGHKCEPGKEPVHLKSGGAGIHPERGLVGVCPAELDRPSVLLAERVDLPLLGAELPGGGESQLRRVGVGIPWRPFDPVLSPATVSVVIAGLDQQDTGAVGIARGNAPVGRRPSDEEVPGNPDPVDLCEGRPCKPVMQAGNVIEAWGQGLVNHLQASATDGLEPVVQVELLPDQPAEMRGVEAEHVTAGECLLT
ncbi:unannotated protein [freshwater metagenome]|uniref:Unannotated protein n=1 Tax=freshwater metagenome TaxID=449393 RepID=A0A6J7RWW5_9ZZZZ